MVKTGKQEQYQPLLAENPDFIRLQIQQSIDMYRSSTSTLVQILTVLVVGDVTVAGFAMNQKSSGILIVGIVFPIIMYYLIYRINFILVSSFFTAVSLEQKYGGKNENWLASTLLLTGISPEALKEMTEISKINDPIIRAKRLRKASVPPIRKGMGLLRFSLIIIAIGQIAAPFILAYFFQWKLF
jgi:hypothetical protein